MPTFNGTASQKLVNGICAMIGDGVRSEVNGQLAIVKGNKWDPVLDHGQIFELHAETFSRVSHELLHTPKAPKVLQDLLDQVEWHLA